MKATLRDYVDGKADLAFAHYGVPRPVYAAQHESWSDPKSMKDEVEAAKKLAKLQKKYREK